MHTMSLLCDNNARDATLPYLFRRWSIISHQPWQQQRDLGSPLLCIVSWTTCFKDGDDSDW